MTDEEAIAFYEELLEWYGTLPNPDHEPIQFANCVKLYKYYRERKNENSNLQ